MKKKMLRQLLLVVAMNCGIVVSQAMAGDTTSENKEVPTAAAETPVPAEAQTSSTYWTPFRVSIIEEAAWPPDDFAVYGLAFDMPEGRAAKVQGFGLGILSEAYLFRGLYTGFMHMADRSQGLTIGGAANVAETSHGFDITGGINYTKQYQGGVQVAGWFNFSQDSQDGVRIGGIGNVSTYSQSGVQITGLLNQARQFRGFQIAGLLNLENKAQGVQFGSVNVLGYKKRRPGDESGACQLGAVNWVDTIYALPNTKETPKQTDWIFQLGVLNYLGGGEGLQFGLLNFNPEGFLPFFPLINFNL